MTDERLEEIRVPETFDVHSRLSQRERRLLDCDISASGALALTEAELLRQAALMSSDQPLIRILPTRAHIKALVDLARELEAALRAEVFVEGHAPRRHKASVVALARAEALRCD